ncbi:MAG: 3-phosphoshikimate 1-carboxyvinyltransferase [Candidatus Omnitrophota bacterium]|jgi:3-phosphoshikimate 1-carboxyvinyltransferase
MRPFVVKPAEKLKGKVYLPGDKSIAHRAVILSAIADGKTRINNFPANKDCLATISVFKQLGIKVLKGKTILVYGKGLRGLKQPKGPLFVNESGTTIRLLLGVLAGQDFKALVLAGRPLSKRPMLRVTAPLRLMGAVIHARTLKRSPCLPAGRNAQTEEYPPITIKGGNLKAITYKIPVASAQVKSAILLAGLYAAGKTTVIEPVKTRDHTERMLKLFGVSIVSKKNKIYVKGARKLVSPVKVYVPGDISSASFFIVAATVLPGSKIVIRKVSLNPYRTGIIRVLKRMGADICLPADKVQFSAREPMVNLTVKSSHLKGAIVKKEEIPSLIDELPVLMVAACFASGKTEFQGVEELRVKETDRIKSICANLKKMGADIKVIKSGHSEKIMVKGVKGLKGSRLSSFGDHRTAMSLVVAALAAKGNSRIDDVSCISKSFPGFIKTLNTLR